MDSGSGSSMGGAQTSSASTSTQNTNTQSATPSSAQSTQSHESGSHTNTGSDITTQSGADGAAGEASQAASPELVEIKIGSKTHRVSPEIAQQVKELEKGFRTKAQEAAAARQLKAQMEADKRLMETDALAYLQKNGLDDARIDEIMEQRLLKRLELMEMSPEQRELMQLKQEKEERLKTDQQRQQEARQRHQQAVEQQAVQSYDKEIGEAFIESGLPKTPFYIQQISAEMLKAHRAFKRGEIDAPLTAREAAVKIKNRFGEETKNHIRALTPETIREVLGDELLSKIREADLNKLREGGVLIGKQNAQGLGNLPTSQKPQSQNEPLSQEEWDKRFRR